MKPLAEIMLTEEQNQKRKINNRCNISDEINDRKKREQNLKIYIEFIDFTKVFDRVDRKKLWKILIDKGILYFFGVIQCLSKYKG